MSEVCNFYSGKSIFITGGTGFLGICLIEKILHAIPDVEKIYLLLRPKKGKEISERLTEISKNKIFEKLMETQSADIFKKLIAVAGEIGEEGLALSPSDKNLLIENVDVVIHSAATLDFQLNLRPTVNVNLLGTRRVMTLCSEMKKLKVMVHVSSAFVNSFKLSCEEILYPPPGDEEKVIKLATTLTDSALESLEPSMLGNHPNTYTFTKHLGEHEVAKYANIFPCTIVRPSMITAAWKEPVPGWTISKNGPQGFLMGTSLGVVRRLPVSLDIIYDYIPVDIVVNNLLIAGMEATRIPLSLTIYHCTSSTVNPFQWRYINDRINEYVRLYPLKNSVWYPHVKFVSSVPKYKFSSIFVHFIPGFFLDLVLRLSGKRPMLIRLHKNVYSSLSRLERFIFTEWKFDNSKTMQLCKKLNHTDRTLFPLDISTLQWPEYFLSLHLGVRKYINNESEKTLPAARIKIKYQFVIHVLFKSLIILGLCYLVSCISGISMMQSLWGIPVFFLMLHLL